MKHNYEKEIKCPYCDYEFSDSWEYDDDTTELTCSSCDKEFNVERNVEVTYCTSRIKCDESKHVYELDSHIEFKSEFRNGAWNQLPPNQYDYRRIEMCSICGDKEYHKITKDEYLKSLKAI